MFMDLQWAVRIYYKRREKWTYQGSLWRCYHIYMDWESHDVIMDQIYCNNNTFKAIWDTLLTESR